MRKLALRPTVLWVRHTRRSRKIFPLLTPGFTNFAVHVTSFERWLQSVAILNCEYQPLSFSPTPHPSQSFRAAELRLRSGPVRVGRSATKTRTGPSIAASNKPGTKTSCSASSNTDTVKLPTLDERWSSDRGGGVASSQSVATSGEGAKVSDEAAAVIRCEDAGVSPSVVKHGRHDGLVDGVSNAAGAAAAAPEGVTVVLEVVEEEEADEEEEGGGGGEGEEEGDSKLGIETAQNVPVVATAAAERAATPGRSGESIRPPPILTKEVEIANTTANANNDETQHGEGTADSPEKMRQCFVAKTFSPSDLGLIELGRRWRGDEPAVTKASLMKSRRQKGAVVTAAGTFAFDPVDGRKVSVDEVLELNETQEVMGGLPPERLFAMTGMFHPEAPVKVSGDRDSCRRLS